MTGLELGLSNGPEASKQVDNNRERLQVIDAVRLATQPVIDRTLRSTRGAVFEVGCGDGFVYRSLAPDWLKRKMISSDTDESALAAFKSRAPEARLVKADMSKIPLPDASVDAVVGMSIYAAFDRQYQTILGEFNRVLRPGGKVLLLQDNGVALNKAQERLSERVRGVGRAGLEAMHAQLLTELPNAGLKVVEGKNFLHAAVVRDLDILKERGLYDDVTKKAESGKIFFGYAYDRGDGEAFYAPKNDVPACLVEAEMDMGLKPGHLTKQRLAPGKQFIQYDRLRYLVAEKPHGSR